jgi:hypothetical protein
MLKKLKSSDFKGLFNQQLLTRARPLIPNFFPELIGEIQRIQLTVEQGGLLQKGDDAIVILIAREKDKILLNVHPLRWIETPDQQGYLLQKPIRSTDLSALLKKGLGLDISELLQEPTSIDPPAKDEEE